MSCNGCIFKCRMPHRVKVCALATCVMMSSYIQRISYLAWMDRMQALSVEERSHSKSNCTRVITSWDAEYKRLETLPDFYWDDGLIHSVTQAFYLGYMLSVIPAGIAVDFYGPKCLLLTGVFISSVSTIVFPFLAKVGPFEGMSAMLCQGIGQGTLYAGIAVLTAHWAPVTERTRFVCATESGREIGTLIAGLSPMVFPQLVTYWEWRFVLAGLQGLLLQLACWLFLCSRPTSCTHISLQERLYIQQNREGLVHLDSYGVPFVPWRMMLLSPCFLSLVLYSSTNDWFHGFLLSKVDNFLIGILNFDNKLATNVFFFGASCCLASTLLTGVGSDYLINNKYLSRTANRKLSGLIALSISVPISFLALMTNCDGDLVVSYLATLYFSRGFVFSTVHAIPIDLSPQYTGVTMGIVNFFGYFGVMLVREVYNSVIQDDSDVRQWWTLAVLVTAVSAVGTLQFLVLGSADVQPWNYAEPRTSRPSIYLSARSSLQPQPPDENHRS